MRYGKLALAALFVLAASQVQAQNLVTNPGFESGDFLPGWTITHDDSFNDFNTFVADAAALGPPYVPHSGIFFTAFGDILSFGHLSQDIATTPGTLYDLSFFLASDGEVSNHFDVSFAGNILFNQDDIVTQDYTQYVFQVLATDTTSTLTFTGRNDPGYISLDDVSVTAVPTAETTPEPGTLGLLMGLGVTGTGIAYRRLRRRK